MPTKSSTSLLSLSFKLPAKLGQLLDERVIKDGYGMRGKSRWIKEAIAQLLKLPDFAELVYLSQEQENVNKQASARIPRILVLDIEKSIIVIRKAHPELEGVKSKIIRTAIMQRLIRS